MESLIKKIYNSSRFFYWLYQESWLKKPLHKVKQYCRFLNYKTKMVYEYLQTIPRRMGYKDPRFSRLLEMKDKFKGKRCFITCTGPSLTISDLELLKDEYVFGMNSICLIHDRTDWKPDFFGIQDGNVFSKVKEQLLSTDNGIVFAPIQYKSLYNTPANWIYFHISGAYHLYEMRYGRLFSRFSDDCYITSYDGFSIAYTIIQLAVYMGFDELYLLGADCSYMGKQQHFIEHGNYADGADKMMERLFASYGKAKEYAAKHEVKIFNSTRGGYLELFPRIALEEVLSKNEKNKNY
jgi:hypothetical protein